MTKKSSDIGFLARRVPLGPKVLRFDVPAESLTTFGLGAPVPVVFTPQSLDDVQRVWAAFAERDMPFRVLGAGSNVVLPDEPLEFAVLQMGRAIDGTVSIALDVELTTKGLMVDAAERCAWEAVKETEEGGEYRVYALAGTPIMRLSRDAAAAGLSGLEFCAGIPATVGGAVKMNAGAHGPAMSDVVEAVVCLHRDGTPEVFTNERLGFEYRSSNISDQVLVIGVVFRLTKKTGEQVSLMRRQCLDYRRKTQPLQYPSAGSVFRNPARTSDPNKQGDAPKAGRLLDDAGLRGRRCGGVCFSEKHANWLVKVDTGATTKDVLTLVDQAREAVRERSGIELELEIQLW